MFKRNDKALLATRIIIMITLGIFAAISLAIGIVLVILVNVACILITFAGWFF